MACDDVIIRVGDTGTILEVRFIKANGRAEDVSTATAMHVHLRRPDGTTVDLTAAFTTDGSDGKIFGQSVAATFNDPGSYEIQGYIEGPVPSPGSGSGTWSSDIDTFEVGDVILGT